jgi:hypothetical protein
MPWIVITMNMVWGLITGRASRCWRERTSRNRQQVLAARNVLDLKTSECELKHMSKEAHRRWFVGAKNISLHYFLRRRVANSARKVRKIRESTETGARETMLRFSLSPRSTLRGEHTPPLAQSRDVASGRLHRKDLLCPSVFPCFPGFASSIIFGDAHLPYGMRIWLPSLVSYRRISWDMRLWICNGWCTDRELAVVFSNCWSYTRCNVCKDVSIVCRM